MKNLYIVSDDRLSYCSDNTIKYKRQSETIRVQCHCRVIVAWLPALTMYSSDHTITDKRQSETISVRCHCRVITCSYNVFQWQYNHRQKTSRDHQCTVSLSGDYLLLQCIPVTIQSQTRDNQRGRSIVLTSEVLGTVLLNTSVNDKAVRRVWLWQKRAQTHTYTHRCLTSTEVCIQSINKTLPCWAISYSSFKLITQ